MGAANAIAPIVNQTTGPIAMNLLFVSYCFSSSWKLSTQPLGVLKLVEQCPLLAEKRWNTRKLRRRCADSCWAPAGSINSY
ncbi:UNVERIFIED_CONTAM: hypothetical protein Sangu_2598200 [Sesamum angustifolium]|uniref:Uncharacterized protein n=1 Tax=Sesamum angustifolium TaxID=2727405 RepID=A0AAW2J811_9LAMI